MLNGSRPWQTKFLPGKWIGSLLIFLAFRSQANDGRDRYQKANPNLFYLFPTPLEPRFGYQVLPADTPAGADGEIMFRWAQAHAIATVRIAAFETQRLLGSAQVPMTLFDCSAENGDTPIQWNSGQPGRGRHPGGSHDGGLNLDVGYFLTEVQGKYFNPDHAACSEHFEIQKEGKIRDAGICLGPPDHLDVLRQTMFFLQLFRINREQFESDLLEEVGIDWQVRQAVEQVLSEWVKEHRFGATKEILADMKRTFVSDRWGGWASSHHHHTHLRFKDISLYGHHREAMEKLLAQERQIDSELLCAGEPADCLALRASLLSYGLQRTVQVEIVPQHSDIRQVRYRVLTGDWLAPDPSLEYNRAMIDLAPGPAHSEQVLRIEAEVSLNGGKVRKLSTELLLPKQDPRLYVAVDPSRISIEAQRQKDRWIFKLLFPEAYRHYLTAAQFEVFRESPSATPETYATEAPVFEAAVLESAKPSIRLARVKIVLSGRQELWLPILVNP